MTRVELTFSHFKELQKNGYSVDILFLLRLVFKEKCDLQAMCQGDPKLEAIYQSVVRKGLLSSSGKLTLEGKALLEFISKPVDEKYEKMKTIDDSEFMKWWNSYPGTDTFVHNGKSFAGTRTLRNNKDECKIRLRKILDEGEYTIDELVEALKLDVLQKKENSFKTGTNRLTYMQNSLTYLNQRSFEPYIELIKEGYKIEQTPKPIGGIDI